MRDFDNPGGRPALPETLGRRAVLVADAAESDQHGIAVAQQVGIPDGRCIDEFAAFAGEFDQGILTAQRRDNAVIQRIVNDGIRVRPVGSVG